MRVVLHIGTEKTGSSSIQAMLNRNRNLLIKNGYYYLAALGKYNHELLPRLCIRDERIDDFYKRRSIHTLKQRKLFNKRVEAKLHGEIKNIPKGVHTVICSSEHFHSKLIYKDELQSLKKIIDLHFSEISILVYLREQLDMATSRYSTHLKVGGVKSLNDFVESICTVESNYFNYQQLLEGWVEVFGEESITPRLYDKNELVNSNLLDDFLAQLSPSMLDFDFKTPNRKVNSSFDKLGQLLIREINYKIPKISQHHGLMFKNELARRLIFPLTSGKGEQVSNRLGLKVQRTFHESNKKLKEK